MGIGQMRYGWAVLLSLGLMAGWPALAENRFAPAFTVNGEVVTHHDIEQRMLFLDALGAGGDLRALAIEQLTEDRVRVQAGREVGLEVPEAAIEAGIAEFAQQRGITVEDVERVLAARGIDRRTIEDFVEAGLLWREIVAARFRARAMPSDAELDAAIAAAATAPVELVEIAEIALPFAERGEAATFDLAERLVRDLRRGASFTALVRQYSRSASAAQDGVLPPIPAQQLPPAVRGPLLLMNPGEVTDPVPIAGGLAILRLIAVREQPSGLEPGAVDAAEREALREQLFNQRISRMSQAYLQELLGRALILEQ